ncbi:MAG: hypothetical protein ACRDIB_18855, partial [Ardenticatenaceae bacterium]
VVTVLLMLGSLGLLMSTLARSSGAATSLTYLICALVFGMVPAAALAGQAIWVTSGNVGQCFLLTVGLAHPVGGLASIIVNDSQFNAARILPGSLTLYGALAGLLFLGAEARLASLAARPWRRPLPVLALAVIAMIAIAYIVTGPVFDICNPGMAG